jgi:hypothetical protein
MTYQIDPRIARRWERALAEANAHLDSSFVWAPIPPEMSFRQWCERLAQDRTDPRTGEKLPGLRIDGKPFTLADRPAMAWLYDQIPTTREQAFRRTLVLMKCTQVGFTVMEMLATIYLGLKFQPSTIGMFLPDVALAEGKSTERFMPIVRTIPAAHRLMTMDAADGSGRKRGEGNVRRRRIGEALFLFGWTSGKATTESFPMDVLTFDEVQEMSLAQMEKARERLSASSFRYNLMGSTANWPDSDIHFWYKQGTQHRFHTECPTCGARRPLDDYFPACIEWDPEQVDPLTKRPGAYRYVCEAGHWIDDPQRGEWLPDNPDAWITSAHFPQMLSPTISPGEIMEKFVNSTDKKNFYNRVLGKPWLDPSQIPVTLEHMARCVEEGKKAGLVWKTRARGAFMGIDQMGQHNVVVIKERLPDGRQAVIHLEEIYSDDPFARCDELMADYGVAACVVEINPNFNDAHKFAKRHPGRVFLCNGFGELPDDMVKWGDAPRLDVSERRTDEDARTRFTVKADQFKCMQSSFARFTATPPTCLFPDPNELEQEVIEKGKKHRALVAPRAFKHFTKTALVVEKVRDAAGHEATTNKYKCVVRKIKIDPHFSYANQLCDVAWSRAHTRTQLIVPEGGAATDDRRKLAEAMDLHGLPESIVACLEPPPPGEVCGRCTACPIGPHGPPDRFFCQERQFETGAKDPGCAMFVAG